MAVNYITSFPSKIDNSDLVGYPFGKARNVTVFGDGTGTPWNQTVVNDIFGYQAAILTEAGLTPTNVPDKVGASQYLEGSKILHGIVVDTPSDLLLQPITLPLGTNGYTSASGKRGDWVITSWSAEVDDEGTIKVDGSWSGAGKYWRRDYSGPADARWFGAKGDGTTDDRLSITNALISVPWVEIVDTGSFYIIDNGTAAIIMNSNNRLSGNGKIKRLDDRFPVIEAVGTLSTHVENVTIQDLNFFAVSSIDTTSPEVSGDEANGVFRITYVDGFRFHNNKLTNIIMGQITSGVAFNPGPSGSTTDSAGYSIGVTTITLAFAGTGSWLGGDVITFDGDSNEYVIGTGDTDVSDGGTIVLKSPGLVQAIPSSDTNISLVGSMNWQSQVAVDYDSVTDANMSKDISVRGNICFDGSSYDRDADVIGNVMSMSMVFARDWVFKGNVINGYKAGFVAVGGQANNSSTATSLPTVGFNINTDADLKCHRGIVSGNTFLVTHVGAWCWTSRDLLYVDNIVEDAIAESFDTEASANITFRSNKIINTKGQCLNLFFDNRNIIFEDNDCTIDITDNTGDVFLNSVQDSGEDTSLFGRVIIRNNKFKVEGTPTGKSVASVQANGMSHFIFEGNKCRDVIIFDFGSHEAVSIKGNEFLNTIAVTGHTIDGVIRFSTPIKDSASGRINPVDVIDNTFIASGSMINTKAMLEMGQSAVDMSYTIQHNRMSGHQYLFNFTSSAAATLGASAFQNNIFTFDNIMDQTQTQPAIIQDNTTVLTDARMLSIWKNNLDENGSDVYNTTSPNTGALNMYFSIGSKVGITPVAGGTEGVVCTTSGHKTASTFKAFGVIAA